MVVVAERKKGLGALLARGWCLKDRRHGEYRLHGKDGGMRRGAVHGGYRMGTTVLYYVSELLA